MLDEFVVEAGFAAPTEHFGIEEIPFVAGKNPGADLCLGFDEPLGGKRLHGLAQHRARHAEAGGQFSISREQRSFGYLPRDDGAAEFGHHMRSEERRVGKAGVSTCRSRWWALQ